MEIESPFTTKNLGIDLDKQNQPNKRVLIIDDDADTVDLLKQILIKENFDVASSLSGIEIDLLVRKVNPDAILLDLMMPIVDGRETLQMIRTVSSAPVIVLSALSQKKDIVDLLNSGSDDYVTKPFDRAEIVARIKAQIRRAQTKPIFDGVSIPGIDLIFNFSKHEVVYQGIKMQFTPNEFSLIQILAQNMPNVVSYETIANQVWGRYQAKSKNRIKYLIHHIRRKLLEVNAEHEIILTVDQVGYGIQTD